MRCLKSDEKHIASLLQQLVAPLLPLHCHSLIPAGLFDGCRFDVSGVVVAKPCLGQLHHGMRSALVQPFTEFHEHVDGRADLGGCGCLHCQLKRPFGGGA